MILAFQRWIICTYEQVPRDMDVFCIHTQIFLLEDLKVLRRSADLLTNVKIGQGQLQLIMDQILFTIYGGCIHFGQVT